MSSTLLKICEIFAVDSFWAEMCIFLKLKMLLQYLCDGVFVIVMMRQLMSVNKCWYFGMICTLLTMSGSEGPEKSNWFEIDCSAADHKPCCSAWSPRKGFQMKQYWYTCSLPVGFIVLLLFSRSTFEFLGCIFATLLSSNMVLKVRGYFYAELPCPTQNIRNLEPDRNIRTLFLWLIMLCGTNIDLFEYRPCCKKVFLWMACWQTVLDIEAAFLEQSIVAIEPSASDDDTYNITAFIYFATSVIGEEYFLENGVCCPFLLFLFCAECISFMYLGFLTMCVCGGGGTFWKMF